MGFLNKLFGQKESNAIADKVDIENSESVTKEKISLREPEIPSFQGDYAKTIFLNSMSKPSPIKANSNYVQYFLYECGIRDSQKYHRQMINEGYLQASTIDEMVGNLKVDTLKEILKRLDLPVSGKKANLVERILETNNTDILNDYCNEQIYSISDQGKKFLEQHDDYVKIYKNKKWMISWKEYDTCKQTGYSFYDTVWEILNKRVIRENTIGLMRNDYYYMYEVLCQEDKRKQAIEMLLRVLYIDLSGVDGIQSWELYRIGLYSKKEILDTYNGAVMIAPGIIRPIEKYKDVYEDGMIDRIYEFTLPFCCCDKKLFRSIVHSILDGSYDEEAVDKKLKAKYRKSLKEQLNIE